MQQTNYPFKKERLGISINKMPIWFGETEITGDSENGSITLHTGNKYDEIWGANGKMEISWEKMTRPDFLHSKEVQNSIDQYNAIKMVITNKEQVWLRSHELTIWYGNRTKMMRKRFYREASIHGVFFCDVTERLFNIHTAIILEHYKGFKTFILDAYNSIECHQ
jgi:hypothetical protein